jgi:threonine dehydratase
VEIEIEDIRRAAEVLADRAARTPLVHSRAFSRRTGAEVYLKLENLQRTGSFKVRGATYKVLTRREEIGPKGVVAASAGNHAQGVALAAAQAGVEATIVMPEWASISKQEATAAYGGKVVLEGQSLGDCLGKAKELADSGMTFIPPFDDPDIVTGQGTVGLEIVEDLPEPDYVFVPIGGGGLCSGVASAVKALSPNTRVVGVQAAACPSALRALREGERCTVEADRSIADGITVKQLGEVNFAILRELLDDVMLVKEEEIAQAILALLERKKLLAEGAGAVALAALLNGSVDLPAGSRAVALISGGNVDSPLLDRILGRGLRRSGRVMRAMVELDDVPGALSALLSVVARERANVLHIYHERGGTELPIYRTRVLLELETRGPEHVEQVTEALRSAGYPVEPE